MSTGEITGCSSCSRLHLHIHKQLITIGTGQPKSHTTITTSLHFWLHFNYCSWVSVHCNLKMSVGWDISGYEWMFCSLWLMYQRFRSVETCPAIVSFSVTQKEFPSQNVKDFVCSLCSGGRANPQKIWSLCQGGVWSVTVNLRCPLIVLLISKVL